MIDTTELVLRCQQWLMDENAQAYQVSQIRMQLSIEASRLANRHLLGQAVLYQAVANRHYYQLDAMGIFLAGGTSTGGSITTLVDGAANFGAAGVIASDRLRDLADGSEATITSVATSTLTAANGFFGGVTNTPIAGNLYIVERPVAASRVSEVAEVYYDGKRLLKTTEATLDARRPGWEGWDGEPRYWLADSDAIVSTIRIVPCPQRTGSSFPVFPFAPFILDWRGNLMLLLYQDAADDAASSTGCPDKYADILVYRTVGALAGWQTEYENVPLSQLMPQLATVWRQALGE